MMVMRVPGRRISFPVVGGRAVVTTCGESIGSGIVFGGMFRDTGHMPSEIQRILGIEGGGTKTEWVVVEGDSVVERGLLAQSNLRLNTDEQLLQLFSAMPRDVSHVGAFLAACGTPDDRARLRRLVQASWPGATIAVGSDRDSALATAYQDGDGIIVIAG